MQKAITDTTCSDSFIFRRTQTVKGKLVLCPRNKPLTYSRARELLLHYLTKAGYAARDYGLHSFRSGGATVAANKGTKDRIFKRHGRWRSENAKDGYVVDDLEELLSVSRNLDI